MRAGKLDNVITIQRSTYTVDEYGTPTFTWTDVATVRAQIIQSSTEEFIRAYGATDDTIVIFRTRWVEGVITADRVAFGDEFYDIKELKPIGRRKGLDIRAVVK